MYGGAKFSDATTRWATIKQECYSVYGSAKATEPYLIARPFFLRNDHQNLEAIVLSAVPMIVHVCIYLQSYIMLWRHVSGPLLVGGDFMSRMHQYAKPAPLSLPADDSAPENSITLLAKDEISSALDLPRPLQTVPWSPSPSTPCRRLCPRVSCVPKDPPFYE